jgi:hypothetical protein
MFSELERVHEEVVVAYFKVMSQYLSVVSAESHRRPQSVSVPRFEPWTTRLRSPNDNHSIAGVKRNFYRS